MPPTRLPRSDFPPTAELAARLKALDEAVESAAAAMAEQAAEEEEEAGVQAAYDEESAAAPAHEEPAEALDFDPEIAAIFAEEAAEILEGCDAAIEQLSSGGAEGLLLEELQRYLHTLKGGARMAGLGQMGDLSHDLEALLIGINSGRLTMSAANSGLLRAVVDELHGMRDQVSAGLPPRRPAALFERLGVALGGGVVPMAEPPVVSEVPVETPPEPAESEMEWIDARRRRSLGRKPCQRRFPTSLRPFQRCLCWTRSASWRVIWRRRRGRTKRLPISRP